METKAPESIGCVPQYCMALHSMLLAAPHASVLYHPLPSIGVQPLNPKKT